MKYGFYNLNFSGSPNRQGAEIA